MVPVTSHTICVLRRLCILLGMLMLVVPLMLVAQEIERTPNE